jgi:hypothetical protein
MAMWAHMSMSCGEPTTRPFGTLPKSIKRSKLSFKTSLIASVALLALSIVALVIAACVPAPPPTANELEKARDALTSYFSLLQEGRYTEATDYYGGDYEILRGWNPDVDGDDYVTLFTRGCTANGLMCLPVGDIVTEEQVSATEFRFTVEFVNDDGTQFVRGPCCGATEEEMPPQSEFTYTVKKVDDKLLVQELPVYVPEGMQP